MGLSDAIAAALRELRMMPGVKGAPDGGDPHPNEFPQIFAYPDSADYTAASHKGRAGVPVWKVPYSVTFVWCDRPSDEATNALRGGLAVDEMALILIGFWTRSKWDDTIFSLDSLSLLTYGYTDEPQRMFVAGLAVSFTIWHNNERGVTA